MAQHDPRVLHILFFGDYDTNYYNFLSYISILSFVAILYTDFDTLLQRYQRKRNHVCNKF